MGYLLPFGPDIPRTQDFGNPQNNAVMNNGLPHNGDDYGTPIGTPVRAAGDGVIDYAGTFDDTYADNYAWNTAMGGLMVWLNCGDDAPSFEYGHLSEVFVEPGQIVRRGDVIALTGVSGGATGPHCHVGCLPPHYVLAPPLYGRVNPRIYMTDYYTEETEDDMSTEFERDVRAELAERRQGDLDFQRDVRAELAAHRVMLTADRGITQEQLLDAIRDAVVKVEIKTSS